MRILDLYIGRVVVATTFITLTVFISISSIIKFVEQMKFVGRGNYDFAHVALYALYGIPRDIEVFFPMSALVGGLIGIGMLASNSEIVVMQAAGLSRLDIIKSVMKTALVLIVFTMCLGEWIAPQSTAYAREIRSQAISGGSLISAKNGVWVKDGADFVHISEVADTGTLNKIQIYRFNDQLKLQSWTSADKGTYLNDAWLLQNVKNTEIGTNQITEQKLQSQSWPSSLTPSKLGVVTVTPESLSIAGLYDYLQYLEVNQQDTSRYMLAFWRKLLQPLTVAVMLLLALSFIFGPLRSTSMGARIMLGVVTGLLFYVANEVFGSVSLVYQLPPILGALMPSVAFVGLASFFMHRSKRS